jgi:hypothetical protein
MKQGEMKIIAVVALALAGVVGAYLLGTHERPKVAPVVFIDEGLLLDHADEIRQACPTAAFSLEKDGAEYRLWMGWDKDHWHSMLVRQGDAVLLIEKDSPDYKQIVRDACRAIRPDTAWLSEHRKEKASTAHAAEESNRYELRDIHDGGISRSALLDKRTGKVWGWHALSGKGWFNQEDISPEPDK